MRDSDLAYLRKSLIEAQKKYINLLVSEGSIHAGKFYTHGIQSSDTKIQQGKKLRERISYLSSILDDQD